jgi:hypothetical protein
MAITEPRVERENWSEAWATRVEKLGPSALLLLLFFFSHNVNS